MDSMDDANAVSDEGVGSLLMSEGNGGLVVVSRKGMEKSWRSLRFSMLLIVSIDS